MFDPLMQVVTPLPKDDIFPEMKYYPDGRTLANMIWFKGKYG